MQDSILTAKALIGLLTAAIGAVAVTAAANGSSFGEGHPVESSTESLDIGRPQRFWRFAADLTGFHGP